LGELPANASGCSCARDGVVGVVQIVSDDGLDLGDDGRDPVGVAQDVGCAEGFDVVDILRSAVEKCD